MIFSDIARIFDPLGLLTPVAFFAKHFIQQLWIFGLDWDTQAPRSTCNNWLRFTSELNLLSKFNLPAVY